ncbi:MAG: DMT family transporter, partial [Metallosphaera sp.]
GNVLAILSALTISMYTILLSRVKDEDPLTPAAYIYLMSSVFSLPIMILQGVGKINFYSLLSLVGLIVFPTLIGHTSVVYSSGHVKPQHIEVIGLLEPVVATVLAFPIFDQIPTLFEMLGGIVIILSILTLLWNRW